MHRMPEAEAEVPTMSPESLDETVKEYRKGNWSVEETIVLIQAKKMDEERRMKRPITGHGGDRGKPPELRWKWVEDYCRRRGCLRTQNQCNDKWDNLMRDFKRVRDYEERAAEEGAGGGGKSYWRIEKNERREGNLPSNMLPEIYEALMDVTEKNRQRFGSGVSVLQEPPVTQAAPPFPPAAVKPTSAFSPPLPTVDSDTSQSETAAAAAKRRKRGRTSTSSRLEEVIWKSATRIAGAIQSSEEREERREREKMRMHERMLQIEESKAEISRRGIDTLIDAINKLADSVFALCSSHSSSS